jgi:MerR family transcriptional regulator, redox-sensitive transcriptional activator SoxR
MWRTLKVKVNLKSTPLAADRDNPTMALSVRPIPASPTPAAATRDWLEIGTLARRAGAAASALRFYEEQGLLAGSRSAGGRRRYPRAALRRVAFIRVAQSLGLSLAEIRAALATLPGERTPTQADWAKLSRSWQPLLDARIAALTRLRDQLASCIGCGCLSMKHCALTNPADEAALLGSGPRFLLGDRPKATKAARGR